MTKKQITIKLLKEKTCENCITYKIHHSCSVKDLNNGTCRKFSKGSMIEPPYPWPRPAKR